jgi:cell shape-determining protein MreC
MKLLKIAYISHCTFVVRREAQPLEFVQDRPCNFNATMTSTVRSQGETKIENERLRVYARSIPFV